MLNMNLIDIWEGDNTVIKAVQIGNNCPAKECLDSLEEKEANRVFILFGLFSRQNGKITNIQKVRKLHFTCDGCWEFKPTKQLRISFVYLSAPSGYIKVCLLDGFKKKENKWPKQEIKKTENLCKQVKKINH